MALSGFPAAAATVLVTGIIFDGNPLHPNEGDTEFYVSLRVLDMTATTNEGVASGVAGSLPIPVDPSGLLIASSIADFKGVAARGAIVVAHPTDEQKKLFSGVIMNVSVDVNVHRGAVSAFTMEAIAKEDIAVSVAAFAGTTEAVESWHAFRSSYDNGAYKVSGKIRLVGCAPGG